MIKIYEKIKEDPLIIEIYNKIHKYEDEENGWVYHDYNHVLNVSNIASEILTLLNYDEKIIYKAKIACILHDTGVLEGKKNHANRSYEFAKEYFKKNNIDFDGIDEVLEAIKIHSDGFETDNMIALSLILADKLDVKGSRVTKYGNEVIGNRQFANVLDIKITNEDEMFLINFITNSKIDLKELNEYYFTKKIFKAVDSFFNRINKKYIIMIDYKEWNLNIEV